MLLGGAVCPGLDSGGGSCDEVAWQGGSATKGQTDSDPTDPLPRPTLGEMRSMLHNVCNAKAIVRV